MNTLYSIIISRSVGLLYNKNKRETKMEKLKKKIIIKNKYCNSIHTQAKTCNTNYIIICLNKCKVWTFITERTCIVFYIIYIPIIPRHVIHSQKLENHIHIRRIYSVFIQKIDYILTIYILCRRGRHKVQQRERRHLKQTKWAFAHFSNPTGQRATHTWRAIVTSFFFMWLL